jgi:hypothetical protein
VILERAFVRLPTPDGDAFVDVDTITAIVPHPKGTVIDRGGGHGESLLTTATPDQVMALMREATRQTRAAGLR